MTKHSERIDVLGVGFDNTTMQKAVDSAMELISQRQGSYVVTPNPEIVWMCRTDENLMNAVSGASMVLADGIGIIYGAKILKTPLEEKIPGADFAARLMDELAKHGGSVYLFGSKPGVADIAAEKMKKEHPGLIVLGTQDGYFESDEAIIADINIKRPDFLLICLGAPKQEEWMKKNSTRLNVGIMAGLGGTLDVYAGTVKRAPVKWQKLGLEWLYRLLKEPRRIARAMRLPLFVFAVIGERFNKKKR